MMASKKPKMIRERMLIAAPLYQYGLLIAFFFFFGHAPSNFTAILSFTRSFGIPGSKNEAERPRRWEENFRQ
jgi:hypothetical protein